MADKLRPKYHFSISGNGNPGDSNGAFWDGNRYHLMYLVKRDDGYRWGHVSSTDMVDWEGHPDAIGPGEAEPGGCFSGGGFINGDGTAYLTYWMLWGPRGLGIAKSRAPFEQWEKLPQNPVVKSTAWGWTKDVGPDGKERVYASADPSNIWKSNGKYYFVAGNLCLLNDLGRAADSPENLKGDCAYLFESEDLEHWAYKGPFYKRKTDSCRAEGWTDTDEDCMCPSFLPLPSSPNGGPMTDKYLLLFISHNRGCQYYIGDYHGEAFQPTSHGRMTWLDKSYFAPEALIDGKGRQIVWTWLLDNPADDFKTYGWSGVYGLPRSLWLQEDGTLGIAPVEELKRLRKNEKSWTDLRLANGETKSLEGFAGDCCELELTMDYASAVNFALNVRVSNDGKEKTVIRYDAETKELVFDASSSGLEPFNGFTEHVDVERAPFALKENEPLSLRVFVDGPVVEVFANGRQAITRRVYPTMESTGVTISAKGGSVSCNASAWEMNGILVSG